MARSFLSNFNRIGSVIRVESQNARFLLRILEIKLYGPIDCNEGLATRVIHELWSSSLTAHSFLSQVKHLGSIPPYGNQT